MQSRSRLGLGLAIFVQASYANAQATRTWVSGVGDDANPCSRTAPCKTFAGSISKTSARGEINCVDPGGYGALTVTKAITIDCTNTVAGVLVAGTNGVTINAGAGDVITLRGLDIFGTGTGVNGISFVTGAALIIEKCTVREFQTPGSFGILFQPSANSSLYVTDTYITYNGSGTSGGAIKIQPTGSGTAKGWIERVQANSNINGVVADGGSTTGTSTVTIHESVAGASQTGFSAMTPTNGGGVTIINIDRSSSVNNAIGISSAGPKSNVVITGSTIADNTTGLTATGGGSIYSFANNSVVGNSTDGAPTNILSIK